MIFNYSYINKKGSGQYENNSSSFDKILRLKKF